MTVVVNIIIFDDNYKHRSDSHYKPRMFKTEKEGVQYINSKLWDHVHARAVDAWIDENYSQEDEGWKEIYEIIEAKLKKEVVESDIIRDDLIEKHCQTEFIEEEFSFDYGFNYVEECPLCGISTASDNEYR
jgi:hypothetical protein